MSSMYQLCVVALLMILEYAPGQTLTRLHLIFKTDFTLRKITSVDWTEKRVCKSASADALQLR